MMFGREEAGEGGGGEAGWFWRENEPNNPTLPTKRGKKR